MLTQPDKQIRSERGIALIMVMLVVLALSIIAGGFAYSVKVETYLARNATDEYEFEWPGRSGIELARFAVGQQMSVPGESYDSLNQFWAGGLYVTNEIFLDQSLTDVQLGRGKFSVRIEDQERKFNINVADETILNQAFKLVGVDVAEAQGAVSSILDWIDADDQTRINGAEMDFYLGLEKPHLCKNGPLDDLTELLLINGISEDMYLGNAPPEIDPTLGPSARAIAMSRNNGPIYTNALVDFFTTTSARLVNINTANATIFQLIPGIDETVAQNIVTHRAGPDGVAGTEDDTPFRSVRDLANIPGMDQNSIGSAGRIFGVRSATFKVTVEVEINGRRKEMVGLIFRNNSAKDVRILYAYWK